MQGVAETMYPSGSGPRRIASLVGFGRFYPKFLAAQYAPYAEVGVGISRVEAQTFPAGCLGFVELSLLLQNAAEPVMRAGKCRVEKERLPVRYLGITEPQLGTEHITQSAVGNW
jgi:hypothetical protein